MPSPAGPGPASRPPGGAGPQRILVGQPVLDRVDDGVAVLVVERHLVGLVVDPADVLLDELRILLREGARRRDDHAVAHACLIHRVKAVLGGVVERDVVLEVPVLLPEPSTAVGPAADERLDLRAVLRSPLVRRTASGRSVGCAIGRRGRVLLLGMGAGLLTVGPERGDGGAHGPEPGLPSLPEPVSVGAVPSGPLRCPAERLEALLQQPGPLLDGVRPDPQLPDVGSQPPRCSRHSRRSRRAASCALGSPPGRPPSPSTPRSPDAPHVPSTPARPSGQSVAGRPPRSLSGLVARRIGPVPDVDSAWRAASGSARAPRPATS